MHVNAAEHASVIDEDDVLHENGRTAARDRVSIQVQVTPAGGSCATFITSDLGERGLFICTSRPLPPGTRLRLAFSLARSPMLQIDGEVAWNTEQRSNGGPIARRGMGVRFTRVPAMAAHVLDRYFRSRSSARAPQGR